MLQWFLVGTLVSEWNWMTQGKNEWLKYACRIEIMRINTSNSHWINKNLTTAGTNLSERNIIQKYIQCRASCTGKHILLILWVWTVNAHFSCLHQLIERNYIPFNYIHSKLCSNAIVTAKSALAEAIFNHFAPFSVALSLWFFHSYYNL